MTVLYNTSKEEGMKKKENIRTAILIFKKYEWKLEQF